MEFEGETGNAAAAVAVEVMTSIIDATEGHCDDVIIIGFVELVRAVRAVPEKVVTGISVPPDVVVVVPVVGAEKRNIATIGRGYT